MEEEGGKMEENVKKILLHEYCEDKEFTLIDGLLYSNEVKAGKVACQIHNAYREAGWVELDPDQRLPVSRWGVYQESAAGRVFIPTEIRTDAGDMLEAGWRKVKEVK